MSRGGAAPEPKGDASAPPVDPEERLRRVRHDLRGKLGLIQGALHTSLDNDLSLSLEQRIELATIARHALGELGVTIDAYLEVLGADGGEIRLPE